MKESSTQRFLILGSPFKDLTDLLYFDGAFYPVTQSILPYNITRKGYERIELPGLKEKLELVDYEVEEKLVDAGLVIRKESVIDEKTLASFYQSRSYEFTFPTKSDCEKLDDISFWAIFSRAVVQAEKSEDAIIRGFANLVHEKGINATPKFFSPYFSNSFKNGSNEVLSVIYSQLPTIDKSNLNVDELIAFLKDEETGIKRRRLFSWQNDIEHKIEKGDIKLKHLPDLIATCLDDYTSWMKKSELKFKYGISETLLVIASNILSGLTLLGLPDAIKNLIEFRKRELELVEAELSAPGRELAYIVHVQNKLP